MKTRLMIPFFLLPAILFAQADQGPYARIAILHPHEGRTVDFESGYIRHLDWHKKAGDPWKWYGWSVWAGERQRWFIYATFGHAANAFDSPVSPADDERDNVMNVVPHAEFAGNALYEFLPRVSRGTSVPQATSRAELTIVDLVPGTAAAFESSLVSTQGNLQGETLWFRMIAGGPAPRYVRIRPRETLSEILGGSEEQKFPETVNRMIAGITVEILVLKPAMSLGITK